MEGKRRRGIRKISMNRCFSPATFCCSGGGAKYVDRDLFVFNQGYTLKSAMKGMDAEENGKSGVESVYKGVKAHKI